jgi:7-keto-8-aminopelargonate synthetase-like enzyme
VYKRQHLVYSTAIPPHVLAGLEVALKIVEKEFPKLKEKMWQNRNLISAALMKAGFKLSPSKAPIISIQTGSSEDTILTTKRFFDHKIITTPFIYPSVPKNKGVIRLIAGANLRKEALERILNCITKNLKATAV